MTDEELRIAVECQLLCSGNREGLYADALKKFADLIRADEREACAKVCESHVRQPSRLHFAAAIRARGNT
jgi:hypothetical protein